MCLVFMSLWAKTWRKQLDITTIITLFKDKYSSSSSKRFKNDNIAALNDSMWPFFVRFSFAVCFHVCARQMDYILCIQSNLIDSLHDYFLFKCRSITPVCWSYEPSGVPQGKKYYVWVIFVNVVSRERTYRSISTFSPPQTSSKSSCVACKSSCHGFPNNGRADVLAIKFHDIFMVLSPLGTISMTTMLSPSRSPFFFHFFSHTQRKWPLRQSQFTALL